MAVLDHPKPAAVVGKDLPGLDEPISGTGDISSAMTRLSADARMLKSWMASGAAAVSFASARPPRIRVIHSAPPSSHALSLRPATIAIVADTRASRPRLLSRVGRRGPRHVLASKHALGRVRAAGRMRSSAACRFRTFRGVARRLRSPCGPSADFELGGQRLVDGLLGLMAVFGDGLDVRERYLQRVLSGVQSG